MEVIIARAALYERLTKTHCHLIAPDAPHIYRMMVLVTSYRLSFYCKPISFVTTNKDVDVQISGANGKIGVFGEDRSSNPTSERRKRRFPNNGNTSAANSGKHEDKNLKIRLPHIKT